MSSIEFIAPEWPVPPHVRAAFTLRAGGISQGKYESLNIATHVGDDLQAVAENRRRVAEALVLPSSPAWLVQVHGSVVTDLDREEPLKESDAALTRTPGRVCAIQVADCMPVLLAAKDGTCVAAAHAGWRGLAAGVLENTLRALARDPGDMFAWIGPAISQRHFEVGHDVRAAFVQQDPATASAFAPSSRGRWQCDLYAIAERKLTQAGVAGVFGMKWCTYAEPARFFSYRRDGQCGRMAALIWIQPASIG